MKWHKGLTIAKDPESVLDWAWEFSDWRGSGDSISNKTVTAETGITVDSSAINGTQVVVWLSGGTAGESYDVTVQAVTANGRTVERTVTFEVSEQ